jgi:putative endonuclease
VKRLVWFEQHPTMESAITREKRIKKWNRAWKLELIEAANPEWRDLAEDFGFPPLD